MRRLAIRPLVVLLAFVIGVAAQSIWDKKEYLVDRCAEFVLNWQD